MTEQDIKATLTISLLAAYADSNKHDRERDEIRRIAEGLASSTEINLASLYQDVLFKRTNLEVAARQLQSEEARQLAYEMAVCVCDADGSTSDRELAFLKELRQTLGLEAGFAQQTLDETAAVADAPLASGTASPAASGRTPEAAAPFPASAPATTSATAGAATAAGAAATLASEADLFGRSAGRPDLGLQTSFPVGVPAGTQQSANSAPQAAREAGSAVQTGVGAQRPSTLSREEIDSKILRASITNGAIELLPESLSTMAIIPLQMRLVYQIGESYGYSLDKGHIRDFLATVGLGMTSQYLEQAGRKLLAGLLGKKRSKGMLGKVGKQAVSSGMSFAATYALGHVANQYYAGGRTLSTQMLKNTYNHILGKGQQLHQQYLPQMQAEAQTLDAGRIMAMVRGNG